MNDYLALQFIPDTDGTGKLTAEFSSMTFAGKGSAWFSLNELKELAAQLSQFPLPQKETVGVAGGFWDEPGCLEQMHLRISAYPIGSLGVVGVRIEVATPIYPPARPNECHYAGAELRTTYEELGRFAKQLLALLNGERENATLRATKND